MKQYYTIDYDLNRPSNRVVSAPLNSNFGVGVRMWRNGSALDSDITVGGNASTGTRGGYQLFDLSTGSDEAITDYRVSGAYDFNLRVYETNKNFIEKWSGSEPQPQWEELSSSVVIEVEYGEAEVTGYIFPSPPAEPMILSAGQVVSFTAQSSGAGEATLTDGPYIYDINRDIQRWMGNKWYDGENYSDYIEIDGESYFGAYFDFSMAGEYTTTFSLKYANE